MILVHYCLEGIVIDKKELRKQQIKNLQRARKQTVADGEILLSKLQQTPEWKNAKTIATTVSNLFEVPTKPIIKAAIEDGKTVYLPKTMPHRQMAFLPFTNYDELVTSAYGIPEPAYFEELVNQEPDLVLVPGVAFAKDSNYRLGFGGGYYDRYLKKYSGPTIALVPSVMEYETAEWGVDEYDVKIDQLILVDD